ncbi:hypothetical protein FOY51_16225 [Antrihabitans cavernicola]|uniref:Mammalian cell entry protein n=1 Tax=Antrihabitans cavernicola TaxID=2495913 RepID=A0A5A7S7F3_9NOCA|nr:hypothetical protein FOY51_16225 [Spelaeibacter cavernicola]
MEAGSVEAQSGSESVATASRRRTWARRVLTGVAALAVLGLVVAVVLLGIARHSAQQRDSKRAEYVAAARQSVINMTTIHQKTAKQDVDRIVAGASGEFKAEFGDRMDPFISIVTDAKVDTDGSIIEAGLESESGDSANVLVAARSTVTNAGDAKPSPRDFRLRVTITDTDGKLTTSKVEFVP